MRFIPSLWDGTLAAGYGRNDGEVVSVRDRAVQAGVEADVGVVEIDVDELPQLSVGVEKARLKARMVLLQIGQHRRNRGP
jgi:hypothetical protein